MGRQGVAVGPELDALADLDERGDEAIKDVYRTLASSVGGLDGDIVECGVYRGRNLSAIAEILPWRDVWAFDSFQGFPEPGPYDTGGIEAGQCSDTNEEMVMQAMAETQYKRLVVRPGWFEDTLNWPTYSVLEALPPLPEQIAFLSIDCDLYASVKIVLDRLADRVVPGGIIVMDDWGAFEGARRAFYEWATYRGRWPLVRTIGPTQAYFYA